MELAEGDALFSDNFVDLEPNVPYTVMAKKKKLTGVSDVDALREQLMLTCVNQVSCSAQKKD